MPLPPLLAQTAVEAVAPAPSIGRLVAVLVASIVLLLVLILKVRLQAFVALLIASIFVAIGAGMPLDTITQSIVDGMGSSLGFVATIIGLGAIFGQVLEHSGGAQSLAHTLVRWFGEQRAGWAMLVAGFLISIPVFFDVALVIIAPLIYALARDAKKNLLWYGLPLIGGMGVTHAFIPPTPGPIIVAENIGADLGWVILFGAIIGFPTAIVAGPLWAKWIVPKVDVALPAHVAAELAEAERKQKGHFPAFGSILLLIGLPIGLILFSTVFKLSMPLEAYEASSFAKFVTFIGHPVTALLLATLLALYFLGVRRGASGEELLEISTKSLGPAGIIILVTGAGGVFKQILVDSGVGNALAESLAGLPVPAIVLAYLFAVIVRVTQGSATVAMIAGSSLIAPVIEPLGLTAPHLALVTIAIAAGATTASHVNDSGFWMVSRYLGMTEKQTLQSWTVASTIISVCGFAGALVLSLVV